MAVRIDAGTPRNRAARLIAADPRGARIPDIGRGLAAGLGALAERQQAKAAQARAAANRVAAAKLYSDFQIAQNARLKDASSQYDGKDAGFAAQFLQRYDAAAQTFVEQAPEDMRDALAQRLDGELRTAMALQAARVEEKAALGYTFRQIDDGVASLTRAVRADDAARDSSLAAAEALTAALPAALRDKAADEARSQIMAAYAAARLERDPQGYLDELKSGDLDSLLGVRERDRQTRLAAAQIKRREAEAKTEAAQRAAHVLAVQGDAAENNIASLSAFGTPDPAFDRAAWMQALSPAQRRRYAAREREAAAVFAAIGDVSTLTLGQMSERLARLEPKKGDPDLARKTRVFAQARRLFDQRRNALLEDPVTAVQAAAPVKEARAALDAAAGDAAADPAQLAAARSAYADALLAEQARTGVPPERRRVLADAEARAMVGQLEETPPEQRPQAVRRLFDTLDQFGRHRARALGDLRRAGLSESFSAALLFPDDVAAAARVAGAVENRPVNTKQVKASERRDLQAQVQSALAPLAESLDSAPGADAAVQKITAAAMAVAVQERARGATARDAARTAAGLFTSRYRFRDGWRMPARLASQSVTVRTERLAAKGERRLVQKHLRRIDLVRRGAAAALLGLTSKGAVRLERTEGVPGDFSKGQGRLMEDAIRTNGEWVTLPDESGLQLVTVVDGIMQPVRMIGADGMPQPVRLRWAELEDFGQIAALDRRRRAAEARAMIDTLRFARTGQEPPETVVSNQ